MGEFLDLEAVEVLSPTRDPGEHSGAREEKEVKLQLIGQGLLGAFTGRGDQVGIFQDTLAPAEHAELVAEQVHVVSQYAQRLVDVEVLTGGIDFNLVVTLQLKPPEHVLGEFFE